MCDVILKTTVPFSIIIMTSLPVEHARLSLSLSLSLRDGIGTVDVRQRERSTCFTVCSSGCLCFNDDARRQCVLRKPRLRAHRRRFMFSMFIVVIHDDVDGDDEEQRCPPRWTTTTTRRRRRRRRTMCQPQGSGLSRMVGIHPLTSSRQASREGDPVLPRQPPAAVLAVDERSQGDPPRAHRFLGP